MMKNYCDNRLICKRDICGYFKIFCERSFVNVSYFCVIFVIGFLVYFWDGFVGF